MPTATKLLLAAVLVLACFICSCSGSAVDLPGAAVAGLPQVGQLDGINRSGSFLAAIPVATPLQTHGTVAVGEDLAFSQSAAGLRFALYRIKPHVTELNSLVAGGEDGLALLLADFGSQRWLAGGRLNNGFVQCSLSQYNDLLSEDGYLYCAVVAPDGVVGLLTSLALDRGGPEHIYFVETAENGGSDANDGSEEHPWATLQHAADKCEPDTTVHVGPGEFAPFTLSAGGTEAAPITFIGTVVENQIATIIAVPAGEGETLVSLNDSAGEMAYVTLDTFSFSNNGRKHAVQITGGVNGPAHHITLRFMSLNGAAESAIQLDNVTDSMVSECYENYSGTYAVELINGCQRVTVSHCTLQLDTWGSILCGEGAQDVTIERNFLRGQIGTFGITCIGVTGCKIRNNLIFDHATGISLEAGAEIPTSNADVFNNTVYSANAGGIGAQFLGACPDTRFYNNIVYSEGLGGLALSYPFGDAGGIDSDYNILSDKIAIDDASFSLSEWQALKASSCTARLAPGPTPSWTFQM